MNLEITFVHLYKYFFEYKDRNYRPNLFILLKEVRLDFMRVLGSRLQSATNVWIRSFYSTGRKENRSPVIQLLHYRHYSWHNVCDMYAESPVDFYSRIPGVNKIFTRQVLYVYALIFARIRLPNLIDTGTDLPAFGKCSTEVTVVHQIFLSLSVSAFDCSA
jgi:hypothetical protein